MTALDRCNHEALLTRTKTLLLLRRLFEAELDKDTAASMSDPDIAHALSAGTGAEGMRLTSLLSKSLDEEMLAALNAEYMSMFVGPGSPVAAYWESVYLDDRELLFLESTAHVRKIYESEGLKVNATQGREAEDSLPFMLDFLATLSHRALDHFEEGDASEFSRLMRVQLEFEEKHMNNWLPAFADRAMRADNPIFYPFLCAAAKEFISNDTALLKKLVS